MERKKYHIIVASAFFAIFVWVSINMSDEYTLTKHIPVVIENVKEGKALKFPVPKSITVHFKGRGWQIAGIYFSGDVKYFIDAATLTTQWYVVTSHNFLDHVKLPMSIQPFDISPETLVLALADYGEKRVAISPHISLNYREGFGQVGTTHFVPESVTIGGAINIIEPIQLWHTSYRRYDNLRSSIDEEIPLEESGNFPVMLTPQNVRVQIDVQPFAEKTFAGIAIVALSPPTNREVIFIPPKMDIIVRGGIDQLAKLVPSDFQAVMPYQTLLNDSSGIVSPMLNTPSGVNVLRRMPEQVQFIIRKKL